MQDSLVNDLAQRWKRVTSQHGEDGIIEAIFETITPTNRWCVEFGAVDGQSGSNSWNLINNHDWSAVLVESHPGYYARLKARYAANPKVRTRNLKVSFEGRQILDKILAEAGAPKEIDLLSIDIDGADYHIWQSLKKFQPRVVIIECNLRIPPEISFISPRDLNIGWGSSLKALVELGWQKGYELVYAAEMNAIFVRRELFPLFNLADNRPETIGVFIQQEGRFFQLLDGTVVLTGLPPNQLLLFKKKPIYPLLALQSTNLIPVPIRRPGWLKRSLKRLVKKLPFYYCLADSLVARFYGAVWRKKRAKLS